MKTDPHVPIAKMSENAKKKFGLLSKKFGEIHYDGDHFWILDKKYNRHGFSIYVNDTDLSPIEFTLLNFYKENPKYPDYCDEVCFFYDQVFGKDGKVKWDLVCESWTRMFRKADAI